MDLLQTAMSNALKNREGRSEGVPPRSLAGGKAITDAAHGLDEMIIALAAQHLSQAADVHVHRALVDIDLVAPDLVEQLAAAVHAFRMGDEKVQQPEFRGAQGETGAARRHAMSLGIQAQALDLHALRRPVGMAAAEHGLDAG